MWIQCLLVASIVARASVAQDIPPGCTLDTATGYRYTTFSHAATDSDGGILVKFRVRAKSDAHIVLSAAPMALNPVYEVVLGAAGNTYTDVRRTMTGKSIAAVKTPQILSDTDYRGFWITFKSGALEIGHEGETMPFLHYMDPEPLHVHYYAFATWTGIIGKWLHRCPGTDPASMQSDGLPDTPEVYNAIQKLQNDLLKGYDSTVRPVTNHSHTVNVAMSLSLLHYDLDEIASTFHMNCWVKIVWRDERLAWNESNYEGLQVLHVSSNDLWKPDIVAYNGAEMDMVLTHMAITQAVIYPDGSVMWVAPARYSVLCSVDLRHWPWDTQTCYLKLGSWTTDGQKIALEIYGNDTDDGVSLLETYSPNHRWRLLHTRSEINKEKYECCPEEYHDATFYLTFSRHSPMYASTIVLPAVLMVSLTLLALWVPPNGSEKISITLVNMTLITLYLMYFNFALPAIVDHQPAIVSFYAGTLVLVTFSLVFSIVTVRMTRLPNPCGIPDVFKRLITGRVGNILCLSWVGNLMSTTHKPLGAERIRLDNGGIDVPAEQETITYGTDLEWTLLAVFIDRILFLLYCVLFGIMMAACF